jgi:PD-(D/E)XK nuclease superfamily
MLDFNRAHLSEELINTAVNVLIEKAESYEKNERQYLGASSIGSKCLRKIQYDWWVDPVHLSRTRDIFRRGLLIEELSRQHFIRAGFKFAPRERLGFCAADGLFRGHADGIITDGPDLGGAGYPCIWEHKCLGAKGWRALERDGLLKAYPQYAAQVWIYQAYLDVAAHPAIFTAVNADTMERLHLLLPFDAEQAQAWSDRAVAVIRATAAGELLPRGFDDPADWRCKVCSHRARCWGLSP